MNYLKKVMKFQETFLMAIGPDVSHVESRTNRQLRIRLLFEELEELAEASDVMETFTDLCDGVSSNEENLRKEDGDDVDRVEELDALCDLQYVLTGKIISSGLYDVFDEAFKRVHKNNMKKAHVSLDHALDTVKAKKLDKDKTSIIEVDEEIYLLQSESGKLVKPHDHEKVDLTDLLEN